MRVLKITLTVAVAGLFIAVVTRTQQKEMSDAEYTKQALLAAPEAVAKDAGVVRMDANGTMRTLRASKNDFTCMFAGTDMMCNDRNSMEFIGAMMKHAAPPDKVEFRTCWPGIEGRAIPIHTLQERRRTTTGSSPGRTSCCLARLARRWGIQRRRTRIRTNHT